MEKSKKNIPPITPLIKSDALGKSLGIDNLYLKREDMHPLHSHKGRSIPFMIDKAIEKGYRRFAISSSGNAGIASGLYIKKLIESDPLNNDLEIDIMIGKNTNESKRNLLVKISDEYKENIRVGIHERPLQAFILKTKDNTIFSLRQSTSEDALFGYKDLWKEIEDELGEVPSAIFIGASSGTTAQSVSIYRWNNSDLLPEIHIIQTTSCHPIFNEVKNAISEEDGVEKSLADAIVDKTAIRKKDLADIIKKTNGNAWLAKNEEITTAIELVKKYSDIEISKNSALSIAGLMQAIYTGTSGKWSGPVVCIICGE